MYLRLASTLAALLLLFVGSGAAFQIHERLEHRDVDRGVDRSITTLPASAADGAVVVRDRLVVPARPFNSHSREGCPVCDQLLHLVAVATVLLFVFGPFAAALTFRVASVDWPLLVAFTSPRSSRGPPLFA